MNLDKIDDILLISFKIGRNLTDDFLPVYRIGKNYRYITHILNHLCPSESFDGKLKFNSETKSDATYSLDRGGSSSSP
jgi:hypothetical protein